MKIESKKDTVTNEVLNSLKKKKQLKEQNSEIITDPLGSWTGVPTDDPYDKPIQDADDL